MVNKLETNTKKNNQLKNIYEKMTMVRMEMHELEQHFGMIHELTVAKSQELDRVINEYMFYKFKVATQLAS